MLKKGFTTFILSFFVIWVLAQNSFTIVKQTPDKIVIRLKAGEPVFNKIKMADGTGYKVSIPGGSSIMKKGFPDLQKLTTSVICPAGTKWQVSDITTGDYTDYNKVVLPSKGNVSRIINIDSLPYPYNEFYNTNSFFPTQLADTREPYILRDFIGQTIVFYPLTYNPITRTLRKYNSIIVELNLTKDNKTQTLNARQNQSLSKEFNDIYKSHFLNYGYTGMAKRYVPVGEDGGMLIICYDAFMDAMQPFVAWKKEKGIATEIIPISLVGNSPSQIKNYIRNYYNTHNLSFVLLVGDAAEIPTSKIYSTDVSDSVDSDNNYGYLVGNDSYPEVIVGRFSADNNTDVITQVNKVIQYEKYPAPNASWYKTGIAIGSNLGAGLGLNGLPDWRFERDIRSELLSYTYSNISELYDGDHGGADANGNPTATNVVNAINAGISIINYTGHGSYNSLLTSGFSNGYVPSLINTSAFPFMCVVGCQAGNFINYTCLAEALARATNNNSPTGTIASLMSTIDQSWEPPMEGQAAFNRILTENEPGNIKHSFGGIVVNACMEMNDMFDTAGAEITDTWVCFGDPSVVVRTDTPGIITASHPSSIPTGTSSLLISCNTEGALACLTLNGEILSTATVIGGLATLSFNAIVIPDTIHICITAYNKIPYLDNIPVVAVNSPYVVLNSYFIDDAAGNNNSEADYGENNALIVTLKNIGTFTASGVKGILGSNDPYITVSDSNKNFGSIAAGEITLSASAFRFIVSDSVPDQHVALFNIHFSDDSGNSWNSPFSITINAPKLSVVSRTISDKAGNNNSHLDIGETDTLLIVTKNIGHSKSSSGTGALSTPGSQVTIQDSPQSLNALEVGETDTAKFTLLVHPDATKYSIEYFAYNHSAGFYNTESNFNEKIGSAVEQFETNDFNSFKWQQLGSASWFTTTENPYEGTYCAQSGQVGSSQTSTLAIQIYSWFDDTISFAKRVSSEQSYDFLYFYIDSIPMDRWSGEMPWEVVSYPVSAGGHLFKWSYSKDFSDNAGEDAAWVDDIILPRTELATFVTNAPVENDFIIAPNPASYFLQLQYTINHPALVSIDICNLLGQKVMTLSDNRSTDTAMQNLSVNTSNLINGNYFIRFIVNGKVYTRKLMVIK